VLKGLGSEEGVKTFPRKLLSFCGLEMAYLSAYLVQCTCNSVIQNRLSRFAARGAPVPRASHGSGYAYVKGLVLMLVACGEVRGRMLITVNN